jgi:diketogulonate reductase-like aldo/keto reductase
MRPEAMINRTRSVEQRRFGSTLREVPVIGQGTWNLEHGGAEAAILALRRGLDLGMTHIDTAEMYGSGAAETLVAKAIAGRRDEVFVVSKVLPNNASRNGTIAACDRSLKRLGTDRLDCYLLHWRGSHPLADTVAAFERLQSDGKILSWGVSNFDVDDLDELSEAGKPACNQVLYHLRERAIEHAVIPWCEENDVAVVAYSPFGHVGGFPEPHSAGGRVLKAIAERQKATPRQVALRFLTRRASLFAIPKASSTEHVEENAGAGALDLSAAELAQIDAAFPLGSRPRSLPML